MATLYDIVQLHDAKRHIRLLDLYSGELDDEIRGTLPVANLADAPEYDALSYTWGEANMNRMICITVREALFHIPVTDNLFAALRRLRSPTSTVSLWVDAVCMNQSSTSEKGDQIGMMGDIYSYAATTFKWLGELNGLERVGSSDLDAQAIWINLLACDSTRQQWHQRAWVFQEAIRSKRCILCFGCRRVPIDKDLLAVAKIWTANEAQKAKITQFWSLLLATVDTCDEFSQAHLSLLRLSCSTASMRAKDPRDKIYSLLGLIDDQQVSNFGLDYALSLEEVFSRATFASILRENVYALLAVHIDLDQLGRRNSLPTWCIEFDRLKIDSYSGQSDVPKWLYHMTGKSVTTPSNDFLPTSVKLSDDNRLLAVSGLAIRWIKLVVTTVEDLPFQSKDISQPRLFCNVHTGDIYNFVEDLHETLRCDDVKSLTRAILYSDSRHRSGFDAWDELIADEHSRLQYVEELGIDAVKDVDLAARGRIQQLACFHLYLDNDKTWFFLESGHIGLAPNGIARGDVLVAVQGCILALILRRRNQHWTFHGLAWVHAFNMETFTAQAATERFIIC